MNEAMAEVVASFELDDRVCVYTVSGAVFTGDIAETRVPGRVLTMYRPNKEFININVDHIVAIQMEKPA